MEIVLVFMPLARDHWFNSLLAIIRKVLSKVFQRLKEGEIPKKKKKKNQEKGRGEERAEINRRK